MGSVGGELEAGYVRHVEAAQTIQGDFHLGSRPHPGLCIRELLS
jgi:hypothetical protein